MYTVDFEKLIEKEGFTEVFSEDYVLEDSKEVMKAFFHIKEGSLVVFTTYEENYLNEAKLYFNWVCGKNPFGFGFSGSHFEWEPDKNGISGYIHLHENFSEKINELRQHGKFITPWVENPFVWLVTSKDEHDVREKFGFNIGANEEYNRIIKERFDKLPEYVRNRCKGKW